MNVAQRSALDRCAPLKTPDVSRVSRRKNLFSKESGMTVPVTTIDENRGERE
jgi:hypothetical protein